MDNQTVTKIKEAIGKSNNIGIVVGKDSSLDRMAAALSLYLLLRNANKKVIVASPSEPIVEISSLVGIDRVQNALGGEGGDLVVSFPYIEGEIEKVSYTLEKGFLNIIVKASEIGLSFTENDVQYSRGGGGNVDLLIIIGTPQLSEIESIYSADKLKTTKIINLDNNPKNQGYGDVVAVYPQASSLSEQIADMALLLGLQIDQDAAQNLLSGIISATKNFQDQHTSSLAFEMASYLMKQGAIRERATTASREENFAPSMSPAPRLAPRQNPSVSHTPKQQPNLNSNHQQQDPAEQTDDDESAPQDWLSPKVYRGSSEV